MMDYRLDPDEARELQAELSAGEWQALLQVQRQLLEAPLASPSAGFAGRVLAGVAARERAEAHRRNVVGAALCTLAAVVVLTYAIASSPLQALFQVGGWAALVNNGLAVLDLGSTVFILVQALAATLLAALPWPVLLLFALLALALTLIWARVVAGAPLNRPLDATEAFQ